MSHWTRRQLCAVAMAAAAPLLSGCRIGPHAKSGAGEALDVCSGLKAYNTVSEPALTQPRSVLAYVDSVRRVLHRIDLKSQYSDINGSKRPVPQVVADDLGAERSAYDGLRQRVASTADPSLLRTTVTDFTGSSAFSSADTALELWASNNCESA
jgi:hypothetical protein